MSINTRPLKSFLPPWVWAIVAIEVLVPSFFALASLNNPSLWGEAQLGVYGELYVIRNLAMAFGVAIAALWLRSHAAVLATIAARFVTDAVDIGAGFARGPDGQTFALLVIFSLILLVIPALGLRWLVRQHGTSG